MVEEKPKAPAGTGLPKQHAGYKSTYPLTAFSSEPQMQAFGCRWAKVRESGKWLGLEQEKVGELGEELWVV